MSGDSEATSERTPSVCMSSNNDLSSHSRLEYSSDDLLVSDRESAFDPSLEEASPLGQRLKEVILLNNWSIHDFLVDMSDEVFGKLRPYFQIPNNVPIRKGVIGEECYDERSSDIGFYETAFIVGLHLLLSSLHRRLASFMGMSISQLIPNALRIFIGTEVLWGQLNGGRHSLTLKKFFYCYKP